MDRYCWQEIKKKIQNFFTLIHIRNGNPGLIPDEWVSSAVKGLWPFAQQLPVTLFVLVPLILLVEDSYKTDDQQQSHYQHHSPGIFEKKRCWPRLGSQPEAKFTAIGMAKPVHRDTYEELPEYFLPPGTILFPIPDKMLFLPRQHGYFCAQRYK